MYPYNELNYFYSFLVHHIQGILKQEIIISTVKHAWPWINMAFVY